MKITENKHGWANQYGSSSILSFALFLTLCKWKHLPAFKTNKFVVCRIYSEFLW